MIGSDDIRLRARHRSRSALAVRAGKRGGDDKFDRELRRSPNEGPCRVPVQPVCIAATVPPGGCGEDRVRGDVGRRPLRSLRLLADTAEEIEVLGLAPSRHPTRRARTATRSRSAVLWRCPSSTTPTSKSAANEPGHEWVGAGVPVSLAVTGHGTYSRFPHQLVIGEAVPSAIEPEHLYLNSIISLRGASQRASRPRAGQYAQISS